MSVDIPTLENALLELRPLSPIERMYWLFTTANNDPNGCFEPADPSVHLDVGRKTVLALGVYGYGDGAAQTAYSWMRAAERVISGHGQIEQAKAILAPRGKPTPGKQQIAACETLIQKSADIDLVLHAKSRLHELRAAS